MKQSSRWTRGEDKEQVIRKLQRSKSVLLQLRDLLQEDLQGVYKNMSSDTLFEDPNWDHKQAYLLGKSQTLQRIINDLIPNYED